MTIIIGYNDKKNKEIILASDRQATRGKEPIHNVTKIFSKKLEIVDDKKQIIETKTLWFGHTGLATNSNYLKYAFELPQKNVNESIEKYLIKKLIKEFNEELIENNLVKVKESMIKADDWFLVIIDNKIYKISCNLGVVDKVIKAIKCVNTYDIYCNDNYDIKKIPYN